MNTITHTTALLHPTKNIPSLNTIRASSSQSQSNVTTRRTAVTTFLATSLALLGVQSTPLALAQNWGNYSFMKERFFMPGLSPEDARDRIKQTAQGLHSMREMLDTMSWKYVMKYTRQKQAFLDLDLKNAMSTLPQSRMEEYVKTANELIDNMLKMDEYIRTPRVYESYLYYEKSLKSLDELVALLD